MRLIAPPITRRRSGFGLTDVLVLIGCVVIVGLVVLPPILENLARSAGRIHCASNLRQIAMAAIIYATDNDRHLPRTYYDPTAPVDLTDRGGSGDNPTPTPFRGDSPTAPVGANNVAASLFLLVRESDLPPAVLACDGPDPIELIPRANRQEVSNFPRPFPSYCTYSFCNPFPTQTAVSDGWLYTIDASSDMPLVADQNFGDNAQGGPTKVQPYSPGAKLRAANSANHWFEGQHVAYVDARVEWQTTAFCGRSRPGVAWRDNIYAAQVGVDPATGEGGKISDLPADGRDTVMLPTSRDVPAGMAAAILSREPGMTPTPRAKPLWPTVRPILLLLLMLGLLAWRVWYYLKRKPPASSVPVEARPKRSTE